MRPAVSRLDPHERHAEIHGLERRLMRSANNGMAGSDYLTAGGPQVIGSTLIIWTCRRE